MSQQALMIIDMQNDYFPNGKWPLEGVEEAADNVAALLQKARAEGLPVVHIQHVNEEEDVPFFLAGTDGVAIHPTLVPQQGEILVRKTEPNAFNGTELDEILKAGGITRLTMCGAMSHMCVDATARAAADLGYDITVIHDACATHDQTFAGQTIPARQVHGAFMAALGFGYAALQETKAYLA